MTTFRYAALATATFLLAACGGDVRETKITPELLENPELAQRVGNRLAPDDRQLFSRYLLGRMMSGTALGALGKPVVNAAGKDPATVGEAIDLVRANDVKNAKKEALYAELKIKEEALREKREDLNKIAETANWAQKETDAANAVIDEINALRSDYEARIAAIH